LIFLGSLRATLAVCLSIPLSALATFLVLALGGQEVALPVLAATLTTGVVFFPVTFLYGVSRFLFSALALAVVIALFASYFVAMTVVPLFCARFLLTPHGEHHPKTTGGVGRRFNVWFNAGFDRMLGGYTRLVGSALRRPAAVLTGSAAVFGLSLILYPRLGVAFFPRTDAGQFVINLKASPGTRLEVTSQDTAKVEALVRQVVAPEDLGIVVSNIGVASDFSSIYTSNSAQHTAFVQVSLQEGHKVGSYEYMNRVRRRLAAELPSLSAYLQSGGLVDAVLNLGLPAPIDLQVSGSDLRAVHGIASQLAAKVRGIQNVSDVFIPQDIDYPALALDIDRVHASQLGLTQREVVSNVITALTSNQMIAPSYWVDQRTGNDYLLTVQYPENRVGSLLDLTAIPLRGPAAHDAVRLDAVTSLRPISAPTEVNHYQLRRVVDLYVGLANEDLGRAAADMDRIVASTPLPDGVRVDLRGMVQGMRASFQSFAFGLVLAIVLLYLILVAQFESFLDPLIILLAVPLGLTGVLVMLYGAGTTLNVQSLMGVVMMVGIVVSNSILIVEFTHRLREEGTPIRTAVAQACRVRLRPVLMTSLATIIGLMPMALKLGTGSESYAPLAQAIIGGLSLSVLFTIFLVPAAYLLTYGSPSEASAS
jgi:multidrug efflux pump subunit AcrB